jgi:prevent-host-death family protein
VPGHRRFRRVDTPPAIFSLEPTPKRFFATRAAGRRRTGTTFHFKLSEKAKIRFVIKRKRTGRKPKQVGAFRARGQAGKNRKRFAGKLKGRSLPPGRYVAITTATDSSGGKSAPRSTAFKVKKPSRKRRSATLSHMEIGVRDLRNRTASVIDAVRAGERVVLTVNGDPMADIVPHGQRTRWLGGEQLREQLLDRSADAALRQELDELAGQTLDEL